MDAYDFREENLGQGIVKGTVGYWEDGRVNWMGFDGRIFYRYEAGSQEGRILDLFVLPRHERKGIGRRLVQIAEDKLRSHGVTLVRGYAAAEVHGFWRKLGYTVYRNNDIQKRI